jgi:hypothetical protein
MRYAQEALSLILRLVRELNHHQSSQTQPSHPHRTSTQPRTPFPRFQCVIGCLITGLRRVGRCRLHYERK